MMKSGNSVVIMVHVRCIKLLETDEVSLRKTNREMALTMEEVKIKGARAYIGSVLDNNSTCIMFFKGSVGHCTTYMRIQDTLSCLD